jgi:hypothetical protein
VIGGLLPALDGRKADGIRDGTGYLYQLENLGIAGIRGVVVMGADFGKVFGQTPVADQPRAGAGVVDVERLPFSLENFLGCAT